MEKILIIDGDNYLSRLFFVNKVVIGINEGIENINIFQTTQNTLKIFSYLRNLLNYKTYTKIIFVFDTKTGKDHNSLLLQEIIKKYNIDSVGYKGRRDKKTEFEEYKKILQNLIYFQGFEIYTSHTHEADDVIATIAEIYKENNYIDILSKDNDLLQLLNDNISIVYGLSQKELNEKITFETLKLKYLTKFNLKINSPHDIIFIKAIAGDKSDNILGVKGIGEKTLANNLQGKNSIKETDIYLKNKEYIDEVSKVIELNKYINNNELKYLKNDFNLNQFNGYLKKIEYELNNTNLE